MGMSYLVYPGAHHTRFHHALGAMFLMQKAIQVLRLKGVEINEEEEEALNIAILLHDIGHGPFSHALESCVVEELNHEQISKKFMSELNVQFNNRLTFAIQIFENKYHRKFMHQLISSQMDMDRLDYLRRDSFFTGVSEGTVNSERLISMLNVKNDGLVVEEKGIYSVEKFIVARRLMYWQVYLHKTSLVAEQLLFRVIKRAKELTHQGILLPASQALSFFMKNKISENEFSDEILQTFSQLDDYDIISAMKSWENSEDFVLRHLSKMLLYRNLLKIKIKNKPIPSSKLIEKRKEFMSKHNLSMTEASYFVFTGEIFNQAYNMEKETINLLTSTGKVIDVAKASDQLNLEALSKRVVKYYLCYSKVDY